MTDDFTYGYATDDDASVALETERLALLAATHDRGSAKLISRLGITAGWHCLEVGAGQGSMARWLADAVGADGRVMATDLDLRFVGEVPPNVLVRQHDIVTDRLPAAHFDLVHARAVLQHVAERDLAVVRMVEATKPGGWVVIEEIDWLVFDEQPLPEPFGALHRTLRTAYVARAGYDPYYGRCLLPALRDAGLIDVESKGSVTTMHGGTPSAEWYVLALERAKPRLIEAGLLDGTTIDAALAQARAPEFCVLGPLGISAWGRKPLAS